MSKYERLKAAATKEDLENLLCFAAGSIDELRLQLGRKKATDAPPKCNGSGGVLELAGEGVKAC